MIVLQNVSKIYGNIPVLSGVSMHIDPQEFVCLTGPSGAGKSTLIHLLIGTEDVSEGSIEVDGVDLRRVPPGAMQLYRRRVGVVFQDYKLLPKRTVWENVSYPLEICGAPDTFMRSRVPEVLEIVGIAHRANALPDELSGGEKARAAIARAIVHHPTIILADEPTGNVDPVQSQHILSVLKNIQNAGATVVLATHDSSLVNALQARVIRLESGRVVRDSPGGYDGASKQYASAAPKGTDGRHNIFDPLEDLSGQPSSEEGKGRKIRITSIGRD